MRSNVIEKIDSSGNIWGSMLMVAFGSIFLSLMAGASVYIPFNPVPISLQTLGVLLLGLSLPKKEAFFAVLAYLVQATMGYPVLAGWKANPLWITSFSGGYLIGFAFAAFAIAWCLELKTKRTLSWSLFSLLVGTGVIFLFGCSHLALFVGAKNAVTLGMLPFLFGDVVKILAALSIYKLFSFSKALLLLR